MIEGVRGGGSVVEEVRRRCGRGGGMIAGQKAPWRSLVESGRYAQNSSRLIGRREEVGGGVIE